jgi:mono/diheme cytochrome c family protein
MKLVDRLLILGFVAMLLGGILLLFTFDFIKIDWVSFMEIQPSYKPMENPLPIPAGAIPVEGAAYVPGMGAPVNPVTADDISIKRGAQLFNLNCSHCHGVSGHGNGPISTYLQNQKPADLTSAAIQSKSDGAIFLTISDGVPGFMPPLNENLSVRDRWDVVNFLRTLKP